MKITYILSILLVAVFAYSYTFAINIDSFYNFYGFSGENLLARPYVLITSIFLHGGIEHLLSNLFVLLFFGIAVEKEVGRGRTLLIFLLGAVAGDMLSLMIYPFDAISIGASAGIFALIGIGMLVRPLDLSLYPLVIPIPLIFLGIAYSLYNIYGFFFLSGSDVSYIAHFGGLIVGLLVGFAKTGIRKGLLRLALGLIATVGIILALWFFLLK